MKREKIAKRVKLLVAIIALGAFLGVPKNVLDLIVGGFIKYLIIGAIASSAVGTFVEASSGNTLKRLSINVEFFGVNFSVTIFAVTVTVLKFLIFK